MVSGLVKGLKTCNHFEDLQPFIPEAFARALVGLDVEEME